MRMSDDDRRLIEQALSDLDARYSGDRYPATTVLWEAASRNKCSVAELLRGYFQSGEPPAVVDKRQARPGSLESLSDEELVEKAGWVLSQRDTHRYFRDSQLAFLADVEFKLDRFGSFTAEQRKFIVDLVRKCERYSRTRSAA